MYPAFKQKKLWSSYYILDHNFLTCTVHRFKQQSTVATTKMANDKNIKVRR